MSSDKTLFVPGELHNLIAEMVQQDAVTTSRLETLWALSVTSRELHKIYNRVLYEVGMELERILWQHGWRSFDEREAVLLGFTDSTLRRILQFYSPSIR